MKRHYFVPLLLVVVSLTWLATSAQAITHLGKNPFFKPPLTSSDQMKQMLVEKKDDVKKGLTMAGNGELFTPLMEQLPEATVTTVEYQKGQHLQWMFYRRNGKGPVRVDKDVTWESDEAFTGYEFFIDYQGNRYTFTVPLVCGNLALNSVGPTPAPAPVPAPVVKEAPPVTEAPAAEPAVAPKAMPFVVDAGYMYQFDPANYLFLRGGYEYVVNDNISLLGMVGIAPKLNGTNGKTAFLVDVMANYKYNKMFAGLGLGGWITNGDSDLEDEDSDVDIILDLGYQIYEKPDAYKISAFVEVRSAIDELDDFDKYGRIGAGLRFNF